MPSSLQSFSEASIAEINGILLLELVLRDWLSDIAKVSPDANHLPDFINKCLILVWFIKSYKSSRMLSGTASHQDSTEVTAPSSEAAFVLLILAAPRIHFLL